MAHTTSDPLFYPSELRQRPGTVVGGTLPLRPGVSFRKMNTHNPYFGRALIPAQLREVVKAAKKRLHRFSFDAIAVSGASGMMVAGAFSLELDKPAIVVRKTPMLCHSDASVEYEMPIYDLVREKGALRYLIVDDFVQTGATVKRIKSKIKMEFDPYTTRCAGVYIYQGGLPLDVCSASLGFRVINPDGGYF